MKGCLENFFDFVTTPETYPSTSPYSKIGPFAPEIYYIRPKFTNSPLWLSFLLQLYFCLNVYDYANGHTHQVGILSFY